VSHVQLAHVLGGMPSPHTPYTAQFKDFGGVM
jgi:hypothetical protein